MKTFIIIWTILIIIALLSLPVVCYYGFFTHNKKVVRKIQRNNWIKEVSLSDLNMDYKAGYIDAIKKTEIFDK